MQSNQSRTCCILDCSPACETDFTDEPLDSRFLTGLGPGFAALDANGAKFAIAALVLAAATGTLTWDIWDCVTVALLVIDTAGSIWNYLSHAWGWWGDRRSALCILIGSSVAVTLMVLLGIGITIAFPKPLVVTPTYVYFLFEWGTCFFKLPVFLYYWYKVVTGGIAIQDTTQH